MTIFRTLILLGLLVGSAAHGATLKVATLSPEGSLWMTLLREGAKEIETATADRVKFKFYPGGVMGDDKAVMRKIRVGQLHGAVITSGGLVQKYPDIGLYNMPMAFQSLDEVDYVRDRMDIVLMQGLESNGFVSFGIAEVGFAYAMSKKVLSSVEDVQAQRVWVPDNDPGSARALAAFDIAPIPLSIADVLGGLQTGLINSVAMPPVGAIALQWHTQLEHVLDLPLLYIYGLFTVNKRQFERLTDADQQAVRAVMGAKVAAVNARSRRDHEQASVALARQGLIWHSATDAHVKEWRRHASVAAQRLIDEDYISQELHQTMLRHLADYRATLD